MKIWAGRQFAFHYLSNFAAKLIKDDIADNSDNI
jgi:hypothetical protein